MHLVTRYDALVPDRGEEVSREQVMQAREILIERRDTHLDSLVDKLKEERIKRVLLPILTGDLVASKTYDDDFQYAKNLGFAEFWRENDEVLLRGMPYHEAAPHLIVMAYLQRVISSGGRIEREFAVGTRRVDLVVDSGGQRDVIELKLATAPKALARGLGQVAAYAKRLGRPVGTLILFDLDSKAHAKDLAWEDRGSYASLEHQGVHVTVLRG